MFAEDEMAYLRSVLARDPEALEARFGAEAGEVVRARIRGTVSVLLERDWFVYEDARRLDPRLDPAAEDPAAADRARVVEDARASEAELLAWEAWLKAALARSVARRRLLSAATDAPPEPGP